MGGAGGGGKRMGRSWGGNNMHDGKSVCVLVCIISLPCCSVCHRGLDH